MRDRTYARLRQLAVAAVAAALAGCSGPVVIHAAEVKSFTGIELCPAAGVRDVTTQEEIGRAKL